MLKLVNFHRCPWYLNLTFRNLYFRTGILIRFKLSAKYQFCAIHTANNGRGNIFHGRKFFITTPVPLCPANSDSQSQRASGIKPAVHYSSFVGHWADGQLNMRNRIVCAYRQQTSVVGPTAFTPVGPIQKMKRTDWCYASVRATPTKIGCNSVRIKAFVAVLNVDIALPS